MINTVLLFLNNIGIAEILVILLILLLLFGGRKIPELMKGLGKGVKSFKEGMNGKDDAAEKGEGDDNFPANK